jgi:prepilin-type N-terminal cleavage/methylation domain-containing protein
MSAVRTQQNAAGARRKAGFTLVEVLAALAIVSVIIVATAGLVHNVALHFDRGTAAVTGAERLILADERLAADFAAARFTMRASASGSAIAFASGATGPDGLPGLSFVSAGAPGAGQGEELITLTLEPDGKLTRLVRRHAPWKGPRTHFEDLNPRDAVVLIEAPYEMSFAFGRQTSEGGITWSDVWSDDKTLPRYVRFVLRDVASADFILRANAPMTCLQQNANCLGTDAPPPDEAVKKGML